MSELSLDAVHLRELGAKCRRVAANLIDRNDVASLRQMAAEYDAMAERMEHSIMQHPQSPSRF